LKKGQKPKNNVHLEEATIMEGFRYRVDDTKFPVYQGSTKLNKGAFPIIPIGMLDIWRAQD